MHRTDPFGANAATAWRLVGGFRLREVAYAPHAHQPRHRHPGPSVSLVLTGELVEEAAQARYRAGPGSLVFKPAGCWHADAYGPRGARTLQIERVDGGLLWESAAAGYRWTTAGSVARSLLRLLIAGPSEPQMAELAESALWDALQELAEPTKQALGGAPPWWPRALELIESRLANRVSVAELARELEVHPVHLARVCRRLTNGTVVELVVRRRVHLAWRAIALGEMPLAAVALATGFCDQAHLTRSFQRVLGITPDRLRRLVSRPLAG